MSQKSAAISLTVAEAVIAIALASPIRTGSRRQKPLGVVSGSPNATATRRRAAEALLDKRRVFDGSILPTEIMLPGTRHSHDVNAASP
ncbi:hypothetical protein ACU4GI_30490 [Cupriavidus basilensis]